MAAAEYRVHILESAGKISNTITFSGSEQEHNSKYLFLPDDSIRTIKMKILYELHNSLHIRAAYEEIYLYGYASEETSTLHLLNVLKSATGEEDDPKIPISTVAQMLEGHPDAEKIIKKLKSRDKIAYSTLEDFLSDKRLEIRVATPIGFKFASGRRDATFQANPFSSVEEKEHADLISAENSLLLNCGDIIDRTLYVCLADRVFEGANGSHIEYLSRYYYPGLYNNSVRSSDDLLSRRPKLVKAATGLLSDARETHYQSIQTLYAIAADESAKVEYKSRGILSATLRFKNAASRSTNLEMLFKNLHATKETPYIKFNPGNRRENLFRFYFERTSRTGKKIPYLSRAKIMRLSKDTGSSRQISAYLESVVLSESETVANCYLHFESNGDIQLQFVFSRPVIERTIDDVMERSVAPLLKQIGRDLLSTGYHIPPYTTFKKSHIVSMEYVATMEVAKPASWESVPCLYSICTVHGDQVRLKRVENFQDMDAARILIVELFGKVQYGDYDLQDIVEELVSQKLVDSREVARELVAEVLGGLNEIDGMIVENPGFPMSMKIDKEEQTIELRVKDLTAVGYLDTVGVYVDAILKMTQLYKEKTPLLKQLNRFCKKSRKFEEVSKEDVQKNPIVAAPLRFTKHTSEEDLFAQFASEDEEEEDYKAAPVVREENPDTEKEDVGLLLKRLHTNAAKKPIAFEEEEEEPPTKKGPIAFEEEEEEEEPVPPKNKEPTKRKKTDKEKKSESVFDNITSFITGEKQEQDFGAILQFHSKSANLSKTKEYKQYVEAGMPEDAMKSLSNFSNHDVEYKGILFPTVEHAFQSQKYAVSGHPEVVPEFSVDGQGWTATEAKTQGGKKAMEKRKIQLDVAKWNKESVPIMEALVKSKIERHTDIRRILEVVKQFNLKLVHFSRSDMKWGAHVSEDGKSVKAGENLLGEIYMKSLNDSVEEPVAEEEEEPEEPEEEPEEEPVPVPVSMPTVVEQKKGPIMFDDDDEEEYGGAGSDSESDEDADDDRLVPDGMALKPVNPFLKKLRRKDPVLFARKATGKFKAFSVSCQPTSRHPVILTQNEFDRLDPASYKHSVKYGSDPKNPHHFICPRFWCFLTNSAISEEDVKAGKCGEVIPKGADKIPKGAYVYELNDRAQYPGFIEDSREDGKCLPCCFKSWDGKTQRDARARCQAGEDDDGAPTKQPQKKKVAQKTAQYIYNLDTYPVPHQRWGFLPISVQLFLNMDYKPALDPNNPALIQPGKNVLLRYGVEQPPKQSFLGNFAHIYAKRQGLDKVPTVDEFRKILAEVITLDAFATAHNGSLLSAFQPANTKRAPDRKKYAHTEFALGLDLNDRAQKRHFDDAILAYEHFVDYLKDKDGVVDHQYLWDFVCGDHARIIPGGLNLVILEIRANDMLDRVELVCPTNLYSANQFKEDKDTVLLLKHDQFYEPIFQYESTPTTPIVAPFFEKGKVAPSIVHVLKNVELSTQKYCPALPSLPTVYGFLNPVPIKRILNAAGLTVESQVVNYQGKTIGLVVSLVENEEKDGKDEKTKKSKGAGVYVPCAPSARVKDIPVQYMDDLSLLRDYETTYSSLIRISSKTRIPCKPVWKIKEEGLIVGFLTETNQFVPIKPNEDIIMDGLHAYEGVDAFAADKTVATSRTRDKKREKMTKYITLESQFYHAFRNRVRNLLNEFANRKTKQTLKRSTEEPTLLYRQKIEHAESILKTLIKGQVVFVDIAKDVLLDMAAVNECDEDSAASPSCIIKENGVAQLVIPKWHLLSKYDNEAIYVGRLADELVRNERVKAFMYDAEGRLNAQNVDYSIQPDEFVLVQSALTPEYFAELDGTGEQQTKYATQTNYELANPSISKFYPNEKIPLEEQYQEPAGLDQDNNCVVKVGPIVGNPKMIWKRIFSADAREWTYRDSAPCTFQPIIRIIEESGMIVDETSVRMRLVRAYSELFERRPEFIAKAGGVMRKQGKSRMFLSKNMTPDEFTAIVASDSYYLSDMDIWMLATEYNLPIILFNTNGLKGFFAKLDVQWLRLGDNPNKTRYHFLRSTAGSFNNKIYEYGLIVPPVPLESTKEFAKMVEESIKTRSSNTWTLEEALSKIVFVAK
jgi:ribA/ribD-fused uncharacterized protein